MTRPETKIDGFLTWCAVLFTGYFIWHCAKWVAAGLPGLLK